MNSCDPGLNLLSYRDSLGQRMPTRYSGEAQNRLHPTHVALQWQKDLTGLLLSTPPHAPSDSEGEKKGLASGLAGGKEERGGHEVQQRWP